jgi:hypothetical protein
MKILRVKTETENSFEFDYSETEGILLSILAILFTLALIGFGFCFLNR